MLSALLAGVIEQGLLRVKSKISGIDPKKALLLSFVWFALFAASVAVFVFSSSVFSLSSLKCVVFSLFPPVNVFGGRRKGPWPFPSLSLVFIVLFVLCVLLVKY